ncbi:DUF2939 domain-containing protein [Novosphingobium sp. EMRT-2]|uniref:DUF2939 domain-containing protein n=1 Tax=Novosphingobium sp. EMRT-2 TaxID=2571749 RepID=UPI0010BDBBD4|nr:DUF2939 domain-containing protein [Novosphingobium sp. EMRT-2]QCI93395.1 DUF2939 domain-containing protein [Novosphingobium sp. EMRT-2]
MKKSILIAMAIGLVAIGIYGGSPYYALHSLRAAAIDADSDKLEANVDFPAVRDNLKSQMTAALVNKMQNDPEMKNNPFSGLGLLVLPGIVDRMIDAYVTPDGIAAILRGQNPTEKTKIEDNPDIQSQARYVSLDRFRVRLRNVKLNQEGPSFLLERRGFATWKVIRLELPPGLMNEKP